MKQALELPEDIETLRQLVLTQAQEIRQLKAHQDTLQEQIRLLLHKRFGANSEKYRVEQSDLFNEAEAYAEDGVEADVGVEPVCAERGEPTGPSSADALKPHPPPNEAAKLYP